MLWPVMAHYGLWPLTPMGLVRFGTANLAGTNGLTCLLKHGGAQDNTFLVTHPLTNLRGRWLAAENAHRAF
jgi:hypothetical protein